MSTEILSSFDEFQQTIQPGEKNNIGEISGKICDYLKTIICDDCDGGYEKKECLLYGECDGNPNNCLNNPKSNVYKIHIKEREKKEQINLESLNINGKNLKVIFFKNLSEIRNNRAYIRLKIGKINYLIELNYKIEEDGKMKSANDCKKNTIGTIGKIKISIIDNKGLVTELIKFKYSDIIRSYIYINFLEKLVN